MLCDNTEGSRPAYSVIDPVTTELKSECRRTLCDGKYAGSCQEKVVYGCYKSANFVTWKILNLGTLVV